MATARKNFKPGGRPLADALSAEEAGYLDEHRKAHGDEKTGEKAIVPETEPRNAEGELEIAGLPDHLRHPRTSREPKNRKPRIKPSNVTATKHARTGKAKRTTHS
jgi:hypothetical protein